MVGTTELKKESRPNSGGQKVEFERRAHTDEFGRLLPNFSANNRGYNQRLETY